MYISITLQGACEKYVQLCTNNNNIHNTIHSNIYTCIYIITLQGAGLSSAMNTHITRSRINEHTQRLCATKTFYSLLPSTRDTGSKQCANVASLRAPSSGYCPVGNRNICERRRENQALVGKIDYGTF